MKRDEGSVSSCTSKQDMMHHRCSGFADHNPKIPLDETLGCPYTIIMVLWKDVKYLHDPKMGKRGSVNDCDNRG